MPFKAKGPFFMIFIWKKVQRKLPSCLSFPYFYIFIEGVKIPFSLLYNGKIVFQIATFLKYTVKSNESNKNGPIQFSIKLIFNVDPLLNGL